MNRYILKNYKGSFQRLENVENAKVWLLFSTIFLKILLLNLYPM